MDFDQLCSIGKEAAHIRSSIDLLVWDQETCMPKNGSEARSEQVALLSRIRHEYLTGRAFETHLSQLIDIQTGLLKDPNLSFEKKRALKAWRDDFIKEKSLPTAFVEKLSKTTSRSVLVWQEAKKTGDFSLFSPYLREIVSLMKQKAEYLGYEKSPYDALLDLYEPGAKSESIHALFKVVKDRIIHLLNDIQKAPQLDSSFLEGDFRQEQQLILSRSILEKMGLPSEGIRLDLSTHPFCTGICSGDVRMTTRINRTNFLDGLMGTMHEGGHALYDIGLPEKWFGTPLGEALSLGFHESQSRFWETRIGQSRPFWKMLLPLLGKLFPSLKKVSAEQLYRGVNVVKPSFIRVEADELTYPLHVVLRFEIEKMLIEGEMDVEELPSVWNEKMRAYLGITPPNDQLGCLQDIHWAWGSFGYFPTYTLGNVYAAILFSSFENHFPDWKDRVEEGSLLFIRDWLKERVHQYGRQFESGELLKKISGSPLSPTPYLEYLEEKYRELYLSSGVK